MPIYDVAIIGGGLWGEISAVLLSRKGYSVVLCEARDKLGGKHRVDDILGVSLPFGFAYNLVTEDQIQLIAEKAPWIHLSDIPPLSYEQKKWSEAHEQQLTEEQKIFFVRHYSFPKRGIQHLIQTYLGHPNIKIHLSEPVLECFVAPSGLVETVGRKFSARAYVMAISYSSLERLLEMHINQGLVRKWRQRKLMSCLKIDFILKSAVSDFKNLLFDLENNGIGLFTSNRDESLIPSPKQLSQWLYFLSEKEVQDKDEMIKKVRAAKRKLKKMFPNFFEMSEWERIGVAIDFLPYRGEPQISKNRSLCPNLKNVFWTDAEFSSYEPLFRHQWFDELLLEVERVESYLKSFS